MKKDLSVDDTAWKGQLPSPPEQVQSPCEYVCAFFFGEEMVDTLHYQ